jgi:hypothetical protein
LVWQTYTSLAEVAVADGMLIQTIVQVIKQVPHMEDWEEEDEAVITQAVIIVLRLLEQLTQVAVAVRVAVQLLLKDHNQAAPE